MAAIGILGGMGPQASAHLLRLVVHNAPNHTTINLDTDFPEIVLLSVPVPNFITNKKHLRVAKNILIQRTRLLEQAGCTVNGIACNTAHLLLPDLQAATKTPFVSIPELVAVKIMQMGAKRVGLLATPNTLQSTLYDDALGASVKIVRPEKKIVNQIEKLIFKLLKGKFIESDRAELHTVTDAFMAAQHLDAIILGCTELPIIFGGTSDHRIIDTLQVLCDGLLFTFVRQKAMPAERD